MTLLIFYLALALLVSFLCSILEAVFLSIHSSYIASLSDQPKLKKTLTQLKKDVDSSISSILILNTFAHTIGAAGVGAEAVRIFGVQWQSLIAVILTLLILYFSEIIPKTIGATYWRELAKPTAYIIKILTIVLLPLLWISSQLTNRIKSSKKHGLTREEIMAMAEIGEETGILAENETQLIENLLTLKQTRIENILTPRSVVFKLNADQSIESALTEDNLFIFSRIPVYQDNKDNIIGMVFARSILRAISMNQNVSASIKTLTRPVHSVPEHMPVYFLLDQFISRKEHLFIVHDGYRQFSGIVTLEDALETLLGREIIDEADKVEDMQKYALKKAAMWKKHLSKQSETGKT